VRDRAGGVAEKTLAAASRSGQVAGVREPTSFTDCCWGEVLGIGSAKVSRKLGEFNIRQVKVLKLPINKNIPAGIIPEGYRELRHLSFTGCCRGGGLLKVFNGNGFAEKPKNADAAIGYAFSSQVAELIRHFPQERDGFVKFDLRER
jgi:hypothetical protein